ncbi:hypothetical protein [Aliikangiella sp. G2MR2-5]|uniref:hypothetical protein n=1 Tax=Aliikangiella sp. G2MR2-5 TaxID=2788943 RepID=UPI0018AC5278|nr:hypothetical protein [Aliikangiella sp. G2MR2-5]
MGEKIRFDRVLLKVFLSTIVIMVGYESLKALLFKGTLSPWEPDIVTILVTALVTTIAVSLALKWANFVYANTKEVEFRERALVSFELTLRAVNHIVNNSINQLQAVKLDIETEGAVNPETLRLLEQSAEEAGRQMRLLNQIKEPQKKESYEGIFPQ